MTTLLEMSTELVQLLISRGELSPEEMGSRLRSVHETFEEMQRREAASATASVAAAPSEASPDWRKSITKHEVTCLECGQSFRQLSSRHLRVHDLDLMSYRRKYGIPSTQPLSSRQATARRCELAQQIRPWEQAAAATKRAAAARRGGR